MVVYSLGEPRIEQRRGSRSKLLAIRQGDLSGAITNSLEFTLRLRDGFHPGNRQWKEHQIHASLRHRTSDGLILRLRKQQWAEHVRQLQNSLRRLHVGRFGHVAGNEFRRFVRFVLGTTDVGGEQPSDYRT